MKTLILACAAALALGGCATTSFADYAAAANTLDPGCFKDVQINATPVLIFGWPVPIISGTYRKTCNPEQASQSVGVVQPGQVLVTQ